MHNAATRRTSHTRRAASAAVAATITRRGRSRRFSSNIAMLGKTIISDEILSKTRPPFLLLLKNKFSLGSYP